MLLRGERRFQLGDPLAQAAMSSGNGLGGAQHLPSMELLSGTDTARAGSTPQAWIPPRVIGA